MTTTAHNPMPALSLLLSDARGTHIPQNFAESFDLTAWHVKPEDAAILLAGDDYDTNPLYWDAWQDVLDRAYFIDPQGNRYHLYQDGDLWAYCLPRMTLEEQRNLFDPIGTYDYTYPDDCALYEIASHFLPALINGDYTGLDQGQGQGTTDSAQLAAFIAAYGDNVVDYIADYDSFGTCEATGLRAATSLVLIRTPSTPSTPY